VVIPNATLIPARRQEVPGEVEGKLAFVGTDARPGEDIPDDRRVEPDPLFAFLAVPASPGEKGTVRVPEDPQMPYRRWRDGEMPPPGKTAVVRQSCRVRRLHVGDQVRRGQLLALIDPARALADLQAQLSKLDASHGEFLAAGKAKLAALQVYHSAQKSRNLAPGSISDNDFKKAQYEYEKAVEDERVKDQAVRAQQAEVARRPRPCACTKSAPRSTGSSVSCTSTTARRSSHWNP
jgi:hypothetical protein